MKPTARKGLKLNNANNRYIPSRTHEKERQIEIGQRCPGEQKLNGVVDKLDLEKDFPEEALSRRPDAEEEDCGVNGGKEGSIEPSTTLRYKFRNLGRGSIACQKKGSCVWLTVVGTSVDALALLTYFRLRVWSERAELCACG
jgi:hypothetical protein